MNRDHETQHLLQQQYNSLDKPFYHSSMAIDDNSYKPTSIMQFNDLTKSKRRQVKNACGIVKPLLVADTIVHH